MKQSPYHHCFVPINMKINSSTIMTIINSQFCKVVDYCTSPGAFRVSFATCLLEQGLEQPDKDTSLKVQKDVAMKHPASLTCMLICFTFSIISGNVEKNVCFAFHGIGLYASHLYSDYLLLGRK